MKKNKIRSIIVLFALTAFCLLAVSCGKSEETASDTYDDGIDTVIMTTSVKDIYDDNGVLIGRESYYDSGALRYREDYNSNGDVIKNTVYNEDGTVDAEQTIAYGADANPLQYITTKNYYEDGELTEYNISYYDSEKMLVDTRSYNADGSLQDFITYEYDERGNITVERDYGEKAYLLYTYSRTYDDVSRLIEETITDTYDNFVSRTEYKYNSDGKIEKDINYNEAGEITSYCEYDYTSGEDSPEKHIFVSDGNGGYMEY